MMTWGPRSESDRERERQNMLSDYPRLKAKVAELEAQLATKNSIIGALKDFIKKHFASLGAENSVPELIVELVELADK